MRIFQKQLIAWISLFSNQVFTTKLAPTLVLTRLAKKVDCCTEEKVNNQLFKTNLIVVGKVWLLISCLKRFNLNILLIVVDKTKDIKLIEVYCAS